MIDYARLGDTVRIPFGTCNNTGAATNADSTPTVTIYQQGVAMAYAPTVTNKATGLYEVQIDLTTANGFSMGKEYSVAVAATVGGVTGRDGIGSFVIDGQTCKAVTGTLTATSFSTDLGTVLANQFKDAFFKFLTGSLAGEVKQITSNDTAGKLTFTSGFTAAPANGDKGAIING